MSSSATSSSFPPLPTQCAALLGVQPINALFQGCIVENSTDASILQTCCNTVGSTATFEHNTCGCPFNAVFPPAKNQAFSDCAKQQFGQRSTCIFNSAVGVQPGWKLLAVYTLLVLGVSVAGV
ncbi:hypothetical protein R3P38DRAFT_3233968 [Favolaschia claudopus]|uniref:Uncharacterized protein n=1 Tax=Favolaschia claudopus TaxID=2862362 RepID=A0AAV9ZHC9_9AGAR